MKIETLETIWKAEIYILYPLKLATHPGKAARYQ